MLKFEHGVHLTRIDFDYFRAQKDEIIIKILDKYSNVREAG